MRTQRYEFHIYPNEASGEEIYETLDLRDINAAKRKAGSFAKRNNGPVDLYHGGDEPLADRYITTASPSEYHKSGYRLERLIN